MGAPTLPQALRTLAASALLVFAFESPCVPQTEHRTAYVRHVIDGDTLITGTGEHVRLIGINAPEYSPRKNHIQPYGLEAREYLRALTHRQNVRLESDREPRDKYGRSLAYVWLEDGRMANTVLVQEGMAKARYYPPNGAHRETLESAQAEARRLQKGLWARAAGDKIKS